MEQATQYYDELNDIRMHLFNIQSIGESGLQHAYLRFYDISHSPYSLESCNKSLLSAIDEKAVLINERLCKASALTSTKLKNEILQPVCLELRMAIDAFIYVLDPAPAR